MKNLVSVYMQKVANDIHRLELPQSLFTQLYKRNVDKFMLDTTPRTWLLVELNERAAYSLETLLTTIFDTTILCLTFSESLQTIFTV